MWSERSGTCGARENCLLVECAMVAGNLTRAREKSLGHRPSAMSSKERSDSVQPLNEFHALLVQVGKKHCHKAKPDCRECPLRRFLPAANRLTNGARRPTPAIG